MVKQGHDKSKKPGVNWQKHLERPEVDRSTRSWKELSFERQSVLLTEAEY